MKKYLYKNIKLHQNGYGVWIARCVTADKSFEISSYSGTKPIAYAIAKMQIDYLNEKEGK